MSYTDKLQQIDIMKQTIEKHGKLSTDILNKINYKFRLEWNYTSNSMEGNSLTKQETRSVMVGNITVEGKPIKDVLEIKGHDEVIGQIIKMGKGELNISEKRIKEIHKGIMHEEDPDKKIQIGLWKNTPNYLTNYKKERFDFTAPADVPDKMHALINWLNTEKEKIERNDKDALHPVQLALQFHLDYITIHPFYDGNGRTVRILTNLILISYGYPPIYVKDNEKGPYYQYLADIQGYGGSPDLFYDFMSGLLMRSMQIVLDAIEGKDIEDTDDLDKELFLLKAELSGENILSQHATSDAICDAMETNIIPIFMMIEEKCKTLQEFFFEANRRINYQTSEENGERSVGTNDSTWESLKENWLTRNIRGQKKKLQRIRYSYELKGFKKTIGANSFWASIEIFFSEYNYAIQTDKTKDRPFLVPYGKELKIEELQNIITPIIKDVIENIKRLNKSN